MELHLLLDEDTDRDLAEKLRHAGHDVNRVVEVSELGPGTPDEMIRSDAHETDRILITHDSDHISVGSDDSVDVFFCRINALSRSLCIGSFNASPNSFLTVKHSLQSFFSRRIGFRI